MKHLVTSLDTSKKLYSLGVRKQPVFYWDEGDGVPDRLEYIPDKHILELKPAYTSGELGEMLITANEQDIMKAYGFVMNVIDTRFATGKGIAILLSNPEVVAKMLIYLIENGYIKPEEL